MNLSNAYICVSFTSSLRTFEAFDAQIASLRYQKTVVVESRMHPTLKDGWMSNVRLTHLQTEAMQIKVVVGLVKDNRGSCSPYCMGPAHTMHVIGTSRIFLSKGVNADFPALFSCGCFASGDVVDDADAQGLMIVTVKACMNCKCRR